MKKILRYIGMFLFPSFYRQKQTVDRIRSRKRTIIISPVESTYFKLVGATDDRESSRVD